MLQKRPEVGAIREHEAGPDEAPAERAPALRRCGVEQDEILSRGRRAVVDVRRVKIRHVPRRIDGLLQIG